MKSSLSLLGCFPLSATILRKWGRCSTKQGVSIWNLFLFYFFRLNIPPFMTARTVLEGLESEDDHEQPVKHEILGVKVKRTTTTDVAHQTVSCFSSKQHFFLFRVCQTSNKAKQKKVKEQAADLLRLCHTVPLEVVSLGGSSSFRLSLICTELKGIVPARWKISCVHLVRRKRLRPTEGRLLRLRGVAAVLLRGWNEKRSWPQWKNYVV